MYVPLPDLDDRRWTDLVEEGTALIQVYASIWTNHNYSDPGITLLETLAWAVEADIYQINRITVAERLAMLGLVGIQRRAPQPARTLVRFGLTNGTNGITLPGGVEVHAEAPGETAIRFRTLDDLVVAGTQLQAVLVTSGAALRDATGDWTNGKPLSLFGEPPEDNAAVYFGFTGIDASEQLTLAFTFSNARADSAERQRLIQWQNDRAQACTSPLSQLCRAQAPAGSSAAAAVAPPHHSAVTLWEAQTAQGVWTPLDADDDTRSMTLDGRVRLRFGNALPLLKAGRVSKPYQWLRGRLVSGKWDQPPRASLIVPNAVFCEQAAVLADRWVLAKGLVPQGTVPTPGSTASIALAFNEAGEVASLNFTENAKGAAEFRFLQLDANSIALEALRLGQGDGAPDQWFQIREPGLVFEGLRVFTSENGAWRQWRRREGFTASGPADLDYTLDAGAVTLHFGDGQNGRVPPPGVPVIATGSVTYGDQGNVRARAIDTLDGDAHNVALLGDVAGIAARLQIENRRVATGGAAAESIQNAEGRAVNAREAVTRAVTLTDCETLAINTPGTHVARAAARSNHHPAFECFEAPGVITLVVIPDLPGARPMPSEGLIAAVRAFVGFRRVLGTRIEVMGPEYLEVAVNAEVAAARGESTAAVEQRVVQALNVFFDPLHGGPDGTGWPLGRNVYISEVLQTIHETAGVDHVKSLRLEVPGCGEQCGDVCLRATALVAAGTHRIVVK